MRVATSQNVPANRMPREPLREWMNSVVAHAVCRLGMQLRGVMSSNGIACGAPAGGSV